ncbi:MAG: hypothetical protein JNM56_19165 [Planctomycetia bacterium]|nr:hypothetical protein [Planctomycetia bacterium]
MVRAGTLTLLVGWLLALPALAQNPQPVPVKFRWQPGQVLHYRVEQTTSETEVVGGVKVESTMKLSNVKRWQVLAVDAAGVATMQQSLAALRIERTTPTGAAALYDSADHDKSDPEMVKQLSKYVGTPLAVLRIDSLGKVVEVKDSKHAPASRYEHELPFTVLLPTDGVWASRYWDRQYQLTLEPPFGTGEKYPAAQRYAVKELTANHLTLTLATAIKAPPEDQAAVIQFQPEGEIVFDVQQGRLHRVRTTINKELKNHQGEESSYRFQGSYVEEFVAAP